MANSTRNVILFLSLVLLKKGAEMRLMFGVSYQPFKNTIVIIAIVLFTLTSSASTLQKPQQEKPHPCCYCLCFIRDYHRNCHKLCVLPKKESGKIRAFNSIENKMCTELCALKKEGTKHLKH